jgi:hypothetical protein
MWTEEERIRGAIFGRYEIQVTWTFADTRNAACIGHDETVVINAKDAPSACREAAENHLDAHRGDWDTGRYGVIAEQVGGVAVYAIEFCEPCDRNQAAMRED